MLLAQTILALAIVTSLPTPPFGRRPVIRQAARTLGATPRQQAAAVIRKRATASFSGVMAGLGRAFAEVGAVIIVGGNIAGYTRVMTTTIALETDKGNFELAIVLGLILLALALVLNIALRLVQRLGRGLSGTGLRPVSDLRLWP